MRPVGLLLVNQVIIRLVGGTILVSLFNDKPL